MWIVYRDMDIENTGELKMRHIKSFLSPDREITDGMWHVLMQLDEGEMPNPNRAIGKSEL